MELTRTEVDRMLRHADEVRTKLRRATRELEEFGEQALLARQADRTADPCEHPAAAERSSDAHRSR